MRSTSKAIAVSITLIAAAFAQPSTDLKAPVEILRDKWGVPHIYAQNSDDLFFAQGWITAKDRLFQIDLWRRIGTGHLAEVLGAQAVARDRVARLVRYRGDWDQEWQSYAPDAKDIVTSFVNGINAYIKSLGGKRPLEFQIAGYDPGLWKPEDVVSRVAGVLMTGNAQSEVARSLEFLKYGDEEVERMRPPEPFIKLTPPKGLDISAITADILKDYAAAIGPVRFPGEQGSNNWVVDSSMTTSGLPLLANDPHRPVQVPSLRKTVHLVAPGWNVIGAGEPALPGVALGHNQNIAFGFTIVGIDQQDLYVERINPDNSHEYMSKGKWIPFEVEHSLITVKGETEARSVELEYTVHGPVLHKDKAHAYALKWVGADPGGAGYLPALRLARARNWREFRAGVEHYKVPSENLVYADRAGNIGWIAAGLAPIRQPGHSGLFPVPGDTGDYEWTGYLPLDKHPQLLNPPAHFIATANNNILPAGYQEHLSYEWASPERVHRIDQMLTGNQKFSVEDFERMQQDVLSMAALHFQRILAKWPSPPHADLVKQVLDWDARVTADSRAALIFEFWMSKLPAVLWGPSADARYVAPDIILNALEKDPKALGPSLEAALKAITIAIPSEDDRVWGTIHQLHLRHPLNVKRLDLAAIARPGDSNTVNAASGPNHTQANGPSYREIIDLSDWDHSMMTNTPGESGDPDSKHYSDLLANWAAGVYHPMPYSRAAVEAAMDERIVLEPGKVSHP
ncbi:MAG TPA: penicillin acylase family protein [Bryobacteraceae bacterium]|jgi:penicillin amidase